MDRRARTDTGKSLEVLSRFEFEHASNQDTYPLSETVMELQRLMELIHTDEGVT